MDRKLCSAAWRMLLIAPVLAWVGTVSIDIGPCSPEFGVCLNDDDALTLVVGAILLSLAFVGFLIWSVLRMLIRYARASHQS